MAAADALEGKPYDLILLDVMLPRVDGYELMSYIAPLEIPVIFLTAKASVTDRVKGLRLGADDCLTKPFEIIELLARVETVLRRYHKTEQILTEGDLVIDTACLLYTSSAHGDSYIRFLQGGGIVDPVTNHADSLAVFLECINERQLVLGKAVCPHIVDAKLSGDGARRVFMVAGQKHRLHAESLQAAQHLRAFRADSVGERQISGGLAVHRQIDQSAALSLIHIYHVIKMGRTQMQDAVPIRLGQEFRAYSVAVRRDVARMERACEEMRELNLGGTAIGTGINADEQYLQRIVPNLAQVSGCLLYTSRCV